MGEITKQMASIKGIFRRGDKFLVVKEDNEMWELPGGRVEFGETPETCFAREIKEELGWTNIGIEKPIYIWSIGENTIQFIVICVIAEPSDLPITLSDEHEEYAWLTIKEIEKLNIYPGFVEAIRKAMED